ncbi:MAG: ClpXP protease specificity-enhancing factor [Gammaproteobacteria bacterium]|jgi:stringent starvation protein B|nr:ClpXP protease specificity-enhancing factor [Gammaproteobacteria bacterium]
MSSTVLPRRPYLLRAMHQWMTDSGLTPHVMVDAGASGADVPKAHVRDGRIVLNVSYSATRHLDLGNDWVTFEARFGGVSRNVRFPTQAVQSIYARETGEGLVFPPEGETPPPVPPVGGNDGEPRPASGRPQLKVVK